MMDADGLYQISIAILLAVVATRGDRMARRLHQRIEALEAARRPRLAAASQGAAVYDPRLPALERRLREWKPEYAPAFAEWLSRCDPRPTTPDEFAYEQAAFIEYMVVNPAAAKTGASNDGE